MTQLQQLGDREGIQLALFQDNRFKSEDQGTSVEQVDLLGLESGEEIARANQICSGVILGTSPLLPNAVTPITMAETASAIASEHV